MPIGEATFTQRSIRRFRPDAIPGEDIRLILEAAAKAPNGGNNQIAQFRLSGPLKPVGVAVNDRRSLQAAVRRASA
jgi:nitroreductase